MLSDEKLASLGIYICRQCESYVGSSVKNLESHIRQSHVERRSSTNFEILSKYLHNSISHSHDNHWREGLAFLNCFEPGEPKFRQSLINKISGRAGDPVIEAAIDIIEACVISSKVASQPKLQHTSDYDPAPIWLLIVIFEQLVLYPTPNYDPNNTTSSLTKEVLRRVNLFRSGQIKLLYEESLLVKSKTSKDFSTNPDKIRKDAQASADVDNISSCNCRITKHTPVALLSDKAPKEGGNLHVLNDLHPSSLNLEDFSEERSTRSSAANRKKVYISPKSVIRVLSNLNRGKASDIQLGSLDLFIKIAHQQKRGKKAQYSKKNKILAKFFSLVANGEIPAKLGKILRTTYLVALEKDPQDSLKLRPLGVPSAIRRITAILLLQQFRSQFAEYLLPFNYAIGVNGGIDIITTTLRLGMEKFIINKEDRCGFPTRALVSLDIRNMFNAISRQKLRQIIRTKFPELESFAELLYQKEGRTGVKLEDGRWTYIPVREGFSQGCPMSPVFAAIVLNDILTRINAELCDRAKIRKRDTPLDDGHGGLPIILAYVDDVNLLLPHEDVKYFLEKFREYGEPLGAVLNEEKTRILTTCKGSSLIKRMRTSKWALGRTDLINELEDTIDTFSKNKDGSMCEVTDGLRVLGVPLGNESFCKTFISNQLQKAKTDATKILEGLDDSQTKLQVFRQCTVHKMTHLFASDVLTSQFSNLPNNWHVWQSSMCDEFSTMVNSFIADLLSRDDLPCHAQLIASMSTNQGGLGIQHPRCTAIPSCIMTTKRCIEYTSKGVWVGKVHDRVQLPPTITSLYQNWKDSASPVFKIFNKYSTSISNVCVHESVDNRFDHFMFHSSPNTCKERIRDEAARRIRQDTLPNLLGDIAKLKLDEILEPKTSKALLDMPRIDASNRQPNVIFELNLKRKLRLPLWPSEAPVKCSCGDIMDCWGDHAFCCSSNNKGPMHNQIRDGLIKLFRRTLQTVNMIEQNSSVEREPEGLLTRVPSLRPFDLAVNLDHLISDSPWRSKLRYLGFDVTVISSAASSSSASQTARKHESIRRLRDAEKEKFCRERHTTKSGFTITGDDIIGDIIDLKAALIPIAVSEFGKFGPLFERFCFDIPARQLDIDDDLKHAQAADRLARSKDVPRGIFNKANDMWRHSNPDDYYGYSYKARDPKTYAEQQLGKIFLNAAATHILRAYKKVKPKPINVPEDTTPLLCHYIDMASSDSISFNSIVEEQMTGSVTNDLHSSLTHEVVHSV